MDILTISVAVIIWLAFWTLLTYFVGLIDWQEKFPNGKLPETPPAGFYNSSAYLLGNRPVPWLGKSFDRENDEDLNIFTPRGASLLKLMTPFYKRFRINNDSNTEAYYFNTSTGPGLTDQRYAGY